MKESVNDYLKRRKLQSQLKANTVNVQPTGLVHRTDVIDGEVVHESLAVRLKITPKDQELPIPDEEVMRDEDGCPMY